MTFFGMKKNKQFYTFKIEEKITRFMSASKLPRLNWLSLLYEARVQVLSGIIISYLISKL